MHYFRVVRSRISEKRNLFSALGSGYGLMILTMLIQFALVPLYLHHLGKEAFGILMLMLSAISYGAIGITWLSGGMARILGEKIANNDTEGFSAAYALSKLIYVGYALIGIAAFWLVIPFAMPNIPANTELQQAILFISFYFLLMYEYNTDRLAFNALCRQTTGNIIEAAGQVVFAACVLIGLYSGGGMVSVIVALIAGVVTTRSLAWAYWYRHNMGLGWRSPYKINAGPMWQRVSGKMGRHYVIYGILLLTLQADVLIVGWLAGPEIAATFYLLWRIPEVCILLLGRIPGVFAPHLIQMDARGDRAQIQLAYRKGLRIMLILSAFAGLTYALLGHWFVGLWVGDNAPTGQLPYILAGAALFFAASIQWPTNTAYALVNTSPLVKVTALYLLFKIIAIFFLYNELGYLSPIVAIMAANILGIYILYLRLGRLSCASISPASTK